MDVPQDWCDVMKLVNLGPVVRKQVKLIQLNKSTRLFKLITECLKLFCSHCIAYCKTIRERTGVNSMWIINNSLDVIRALEEKQLPLTHVSTWDFSTLCTSLRHAQLKSQLHDLLDRVFSYKREMLHCYQLFSHLLDE